MRCVQCGTELVADDKFCRECGAPRPRRQLPPRFAEAERRFSALRARYQAGELDDPIYDAELQKLVVADDAGGQWMLGAESGEWYWYDGAQWVRRDPPLVEAPRARKRFAWKRLAVGCGGLLAVAVVVAVIASALAGQEILSSARDLLALETEPRDATAVPVATPTVPLADPTSALAVQSTSAPRATSVLIAQPTSPPLPTSLPAPQPTSPPRPTSAPTPQPTPTSSLPFTIRPYDAGRDAGVGQGIGISYSMPESFGPGQYRWEGVHPAGDPFLVVGGWCTSPGSLDAGWASMEYELVIDGITVDLAQLALVDESDGLSACRAYRGVLTGWSPGRHSCTWIRHQYEDVYEYDLAYPPGDYVYESMMDVMPVFRDDFGDALTGWSEEDNENHRLWIEDGGFHVFLKQEDRLAATFYSPSVYGDFYLQTTARQVGDVDGSYGIVFHYQDDNHYYYLRVSSGGYFKLMKQLGGSWIDLTEWVESPAINKGWNTITLVCVGDQIVARVNDSQMIDVTDGSFADGLVGLGADSDAGSDLHVVFDAVTMGGK